MWSSVCQWSQSKLLFVHRWREWDVDFRLDVHRQRSVVYISCMVTNIFKTICIFALRKVEYILIYKMVITVKVGFLIGDGRVWLRHRKKRESKRNTCWNVLSSGHTGLLQSILFELLFVIYIETNLFGIVFVFIQYLIAVGNYNKSR